MRVDECMMREVHIVSPDKTISDAASLMAELDCGAIPVGEGNRLVGMITDRDIVIRAVAENKSPTTLVREIMSTDVKYCFEDEEISHITKNMSDIQVRRLPVLNRQKQLVGIVSLCDIVQNDQNVTAGAGTLSGISRAGGMA